MEIRFSLCKFGSHYFEDGNGIRPQTTPSNNLKTASLDLTLAVTGSNAMKALGECRAYSQKENVAEAELLYFVAKPTNFSEEA